MLLYFKTKTCIQIEHSNIKLIFITYLKKEKRYEDIKDYFGSNDRIGNDCLLKRRRTSVYTGRG